MLILGIAILRYAVMAVPPADNCGSSPADTYPPMWPDSFSINWNIQSPSSGSSLYSTGTTTYHWNGGVNPELLWKWADGHTDSYCAGALPMAAQQSDCQQIVMGGVRYVYYQGLNKCCMCCDQSHGCGVFAPDFLVNATWVGEDHYQGVPVIYWEYRGFIYMETVGTVPVSRNWVGVKDLSGNYFYTFAWNMVSPGAAITFPAACSVAGSCSGVCSSRQSATPSWDQMRFG